MVRPLVASLLLSWSASLALADNTLISWTSGTNAAALAHSGNASHRVSLETAPACSATLAFPHCKQVCGMWCWATVVAEVRDFYSGASPQCGSDECKIVSHSLGEECCSADECSGTCGQGGTVSQIQKELDRFHPFSYTSAALDEASLVSQLQSGHPVLRLTSGHIDVVTGCKDGLYELTDSEYDKVITLPYSELVQSPYNPQAKWVGTFVTTTAQVEEQEGDAPRVAARQQQRPRVNPKRGFVADGADRSCDDPLLLNASGWYYDYVPPPRLEPSSSHRHSTDRRSRALAATERRQPVSRDRERQLRAGQRHRPPRPPLRADELVPLVAARRRAGLRQPHLLHGLQRAQQPAQLQHRRAHRRQGVGDRHAAVERLDARLARDGRRRHPVVRRLLQQLHRAVRRGSEWKAPSTLSSEAGAPCARTPAARLRPPQS